MVDLWTPDLAGNGVRGLIRSDVPGPKELKKFCEAGGWVDGQYGLLYFFVREHKASGGYVDRAPTLAEINTLTDSPSKESSKRFADVHTGLHATVVDGANRTNMVLKTSAKQMQYRRGFYMVHVAQARCNPPSERTHCLVRW
jgi:hypothetical protein